MKSYVCKYNTGIGEANRLVCELIGASFLKIWGMKVPDFALVNVNRDHIPETFNIHGYQFDIPCFGSRYSRNYVEITDFTADISPQKRRVFTDRMDLFYIALFDLWLANEDRNYNNYNLLIDLENQYHIVPIDHETIFNTRILERPISELTFEDSIISSPLFFNLLGQNSFPGKREEIRKNFLRKVNQCREFTDEIFKDIPESWRIDKNRLRNKLINEIFVDNWTEKCFDLFLEFLQRNVNREENTHNYF